MCADKLTTRDCSGKHYDCVEQSDCLECRIPDEAPHDSTNPRCACCTCGKIKVIEGGI